MIGAPAVSTAGLATSSSAGRTSRTSDSVARWEVVRTENCSVEIDLALEHGDPRLQQRAVCSPLERLHGQPQPDPGDVTFDSDLTAGLLLP